MVLRYFLKKLLMVIPILLGVTIVTFALVRSLPGDPAYAMVGERATEEAIEKVRRHLGADEGIVMQYLGYLGMLCTGDFGRSYYSGREVLADIGHKLPNTMLLAIVAMLVATPVGVSLGFVSAYRRGEGLDRLISSVSVLGISVPVFWLGLLLMLFLSFTLRVLPPSGTGGVRFLILPALTLALPAIATLARVTRASVIEVLQMPFIEALRAKGVSDQRIKRVHVLKNAMIPVVTVIGLDFGSYLNGAVLTETIFGWDGLGRYVMEGILKRDYPVIMGSIIVGTAAFVLVNLLVDVVYYYLDPRVRVGEGGVAR